jgi:hypothetical protein
VPKVAIQTGKQQVQPIHRRFQLSGTVQSGACSEEHSADARLADWRRCNAVRQVHIDAIDSQINCQPAAATAAAAGERKSGLRRLVTVVATTASQLPA